MDPDRDAAEEIAARLRELADPGHAEVLGRFLDPHASAMPRTMLRYALERLTAEERRRYMAA